VLGGRRPLPRAIAGAHCTRERGRGETGRVWCGAAPGFSGHRSDEDVPANLQPSRLFLMGRDEEEVNEHSPRNE
jgi:hypothetical protein